ncbi:hypothetical protein Hanom_Chr14g01268711 [Helianthus anomalus]
MKSEDSRMWSCIMDGYISPTHEVIGRIRVTEYKMKKESDKRMYDAEKKALAAIEKSLPFEIRNICHRYGSSRELWEALEKRYQSSSKKSTCN